MTTKSSLVLALALGVAFAFVPSQALAQPRSVPAHSGHQRQVFPAPAPSAFVAPATEHGKEVEDEAPPGDVKLWDTQIFNNKQPPLAAVLFNFALLVFIYYRLGKKPLAEGLKNRKISIAAAIENAQKILREARQRSKRYRAKLDKVADEVASTKQNAVEIGKADASNLLLAADEKAARIARDAQFLVEQEKKQTELDLVRETVEKATKEAEALLRTNVSAADQERLAEEFIAQLASTDVIARTVGGHS